MSLDMCWCNLEVPGCLELAPHMVKQELGQAHTKVRGSGP